MHMITNQEDISIPSIEKDYSKTTYGRLEGIILKIISVLLIAIMQILTKSLYINSTITSLEVIYFRGIIMVILNLIYSKYISLDLLDIPKKQFKPMWYRSITGAIGNMLFFTSTKLLPLSLVNALYYLSPIMTTILGFMTLGESLSGYDVVSMIIAFSGVATVIFNPYKQSNSEVYSIKWYYYLPSLLNSISASASTILMRYMGETIHCVIAPTFLGIVLGTFTPVFTFGIISFRDIATKYDFTVIMYLLAIGITAAGGQILVSRSLQIEKAGRTQAYDYFTIVFMLLADTLMFKLPIHWLDLIGIGIILSSNIITSIMT